jgi:hypothetical protein
MKDFLLIKEIVNYTGKPDAKETAFDVNGSIHKRWRLIGTNKYKLCSEHKKPGESGGSDKCEKCKHEPAMYSPYAIYENKTISKDFTKVEKLNR